MEGDLLLSLVDNLKRQNHEMVFFVLFKFLLTILAQHTAQGLQLPNLIWIS
jgi:hypothetical protein